MGDFAAGKLIDGVVASEVFAADFPQFIIDFENAAEREGYDLSSLAGPAEEGLLGELIDKVGGHLPEMVGCLLRWHDGGVAIGEYFCFSVAQILDEMGKVSPPDLPIGADMDGTLLVIDTSSGTLATLEEGGALSPLNQTLGAFCGLFRDELIGKHYTWAEGWVRNE